VLALARHVCFDCAFSLSVLTFNMQDARCALFRLAIKIVSGLSEPDDDLASAPCFQFLKGEGGEVEEGDLG
jgi:hypothetical protein